MHIESDSRIVLTLDAGGTNFRFGAIRGGVPIVEGVHLPSNADQLDACLKNLVEGFETVRARCPEPPVAISFAFPGPCDYPAGIIGDLGNLPGFRGGVPLGPMLQARFGIPVFINNDGDLFTYGEAIGGLLPHINALLEKAGSPKRYRNLFGITLGTGLGGGIVRDGRLFIGDNSVAAEVWTLRHKLEPQTNAEEGACIRAVRRAYAKATGTSFEETPEPRVIFDIANGAVEGDVAAAKAAFESIGEIAGDVLATALTLTDGLGVIGGGVSGAWPAFLPAMIQEMNSDFISPSGQAFRRMPSLAFNLEDPDQLATFLKGESKEVAVPGTDQTVLYDPLQRVGVGISRLGTSEAVALGAYAYALQQLD
ncbi:glucokinase [Haloferula luteola]|uniref:Glucokinase n=1 Tax=Haloferula luteola TaxID=595692 RepID=A0A840VI40_9BACT|nr:ROK family protein [Haloferula luteola]MBB5352391.1 glucokinase [Haloferula luteola]